MKRLFVVSLSANCYVMADDESDAEDEAQRVARNGDLELDACASAVRPGDQILRDWLDAFPWGGDGDRTVQQIMETLATDTARLEAFKAHPKLFPDIDPSPLPDSTQEDATE